MQPLRADHTILVALKKRLQDEVLFASCLNCQNQWRVRVRDAPREFVCPRCGGLMVALLKEYDREAIKVCAKDRDLFTDEEKKTFTKLRKVANLVSTNGQRAAIVLAGRGVGAETASRILRSSFRDEDDFLREIMSAEVTFAKNKRFWD
jgi:ATP-dependent Lhr-like helicase